MAEDNILNAIDLNRQGLIGSAADRVDGPLKVTGRAAYSYEYQLEGQKPAYGFIVGAAIAKGKVTGIDTAAAEAMPGVLMVLSHKNSPPQKGKNPTAQKEFTSPKPYLKDNIVRYMGEPVALVIAESFEAARAAAEALKVDYFHDPATRFEIGPNLDKSFKPGKSNGQEPDSDIGDFETAFNEAPVKIDATYTTPHQTHNAIELHSTIAQWQGDKLTVWSAQQLPMESQAAFAATFGIRKDNVRVICKYIGGGFGGKLPVLADGILAALAAKKLRRPVKVAMTRQQTFFNALHRTGSVQRVRLGATPDGVLTAIGHESWLHTSSFENYVELAGAFTRSLYAAPNRRTSHRLVALDIQSPGSMRAPGEATGMLTVEQAMDELAEKLGMDPIELRVRNEPTLDPEKQLPFASRGLVRCMRDGAERFGWDRRNPVPGQVRDGQWLVGYGMAAAIRSNYLKKCAARLEISAEGHFIGKMAMTDVGTGTYTILTQIAAETLGVPMNAVTMEMGDTSLPPTPGSGGSWGANSAGSALFNACTTMQQQLAKSAVSDKASPLYGLDAELAVFMDGKITIGGKSESYAAIAARLKPEQRIADGVIEELPSYKEYSQQAFGAHFVEVGVDADTGEVRLRRMLGVFTAGRILNAKTAHSQAIGGMIWGLGSALMEESVIDRRWGQFVNHDLAEYHVAVNADTPNIEAIFLPEEDDKTGPLKIKGVGELGICGAGAAVANAVYNACGVRVRDYPLTLDKILPGLAEAA